jgi:hypothetical protein
MIGLELGLLPFAALVALRVGILPYLPTFYGVDCAN